MNTLTETAPAFVKMAHEIVWCSAATVGGNNRPMSRVLHPIWEWDGKNLSGWIGTGPTPIKRAHLTANPFISLNYWTPSQDTCVADCHAELVFDDATRLYVWNLLKNAPPPLGFEPTLIPAWTSPTVDAFAVIKLRPWRLRVFPGSILLGEGGSVLLWRE